MLKLEYSEITNEKKCFENADRLLDVIWVAMPSIALNYGALSARLLAFYKP
jgi:hypothetical protein